jgi:hypothetical protein
MRRVAAVTATTVRAGEALFNAKSIDLVHRHQPHHHQPPWNRPQTRRNRQPASYLNKSPWWSPGAAVPFERDAAEIAASASVSVIRAPISSTAFVDEARSVILASGDIPKLNREICLRLPELAKVVEQSTRLAVRVDRAHIAQRHKQCPKTSNCAHDDLAIGMSLGSSHSIFCRMRIMKCLTLWSRSRIPLEDLV